MSAASAPTSAVCPVCRAKLGEPVYVHDGAAAITSLAQTIPASTTVFACTACAHASTTVLERISEYYDTKYNILTEADAADDWYEERDGKPVYRAQHQAATALALLGPGRGARVLDYGCAKAASLREMKRIRPDLEAFVFDVSTNYAEFWNQWVPRDHQASYTVPPEWNGTMDAVLSFFVLEHVPDPNEFMRGVAGLLKPGGKLHLVFPNVRRNPGDLIVADHVNHFMPSSIALLMARAGCTDVRIDEDAHTAAYVVNATKYAAAASARPAPLAATEVALYLREIEATAAFWRAACARVVDFERREADGKPAVIYGSGFYGVFVASCLRKPSAVECFLDQNPFQQLRKPFGKTVRSPEDIEDRHQIVYVGLNPQRARAIIAGVPSLHVRPRTFFYL